MKKCLCILFIFAASLNMAKAWFSTPHMLVAQIAYMQLEPSVKERADQLIALHAEKYPKTPDFVTASVWADDIKGQGDSRFTAWHYVSLFFTDEHDPIPLRSDFPDTENVAWAIEHDIAILKDPSQSEDEKGYALRRLIHWFGDIHQPKHANTHLSSIYPLGNDRGGTDFKLSADADLSNLHALWDSGIGLWMEDYMRPLSDEHRDIIEQQAVALMKDPPNSLGSLNSYDWAIDSHELARYYAHGFGLTYGGTPSPEYIMEGQALCQDRVTLAGYRLAKVLNDVLKKS